MTSCFVYRDRFRQPRGMERAVQPGHRAVRDRLGDQGDGVPTRAQVVPVHGQGDGAHGELCGWAGCEPGGSAIFASAQDRLRDLGQR